MPNISDRELDKLFQEAGHEMRPEFDPHDWEDLAKRLDNDDRRALAARAGGYAIAVLLLLSSAAWLTGSLPAERQQPAQTTTTTTTQKTTTDTHTADTQTAPATPLADAQQEYATTSTSASTTNSGTDVSDKKVNTLSQGGHTTSPAQKQQAINPATKLAMPNASGHATSSSQTQQAIKPATAKRAVPNVSDNTTSPTARAESATAGKHSTTTTPRKNSAAVESNSRIDTNTASIPASKSGSQNQVENPAPSTSVNGVTDNARTTATLNTVSATQKTSGKTVSGNNQETVNTLPANQTTPAETIVNNTSGTTTAQHREGTSQQVAINAVTPVQKQAAVSTENLATNGSNTRAEGTENNAGTETKKTQALVPETATVAATTHSNASRVPASATASHSASESGNNPLSADTQATNDSLADGTGTQSRPTLQQGNVYTTRGQPTTATTSDRSKEAAASTNKVEQINSNTKTTHPTDIENQNNGVGHNTGLTDNSDTIASATQNRATQAGVISSSSEKKNGAVVIQKTTSETGPGNKAPGTTDVADSSHLATSPHTLADVAAAQSSVDSIAVPKDSVTTVDAKAEQASGKTTEEQESNPEKTPAQWFLRLPVSPDFSSIDYGKAGKTGVNIGLVVEYMPWKHVSVSAGAIWSKKIYTWDNPDKTYGGSGSYGGTKASNLDGDCRVLDIPLNITYYIRPEARTNFFITAGLSSYIMLKEKYTYTVWANQTEYLYNEEYTRKNNNWFSMLNLSIGLQHRLSKRFQVQAEPFLKAPVSGVGQGKVNLVSMGAFFSLKYQLHK